MWLGSNSNIAHVQPVQHIEVKLSWQADFCSQKLLFCQIMDKATKPWKPMFSRLRWSLSQWFWEYFRRLLDLVATNCCWWCLGSHLHSFGRSSTMDSCHFVQYFNYHFSWSAQLNLGSDLDLYFTSGWWMMKSWIRLKHVKIQIVIIHDSSLIHLWFLRIYQILENSCDFFRWGDCGTSSWSTGEWSGTEAEEEAAGACEEYGGRKRDSKNDRMAWDSESSFGRNCLAELDPRTTGTAVFECIWDYTWCIGCIWI